MKLGELTPGSFHIYQGNNGIMYNVRVVNINIMLKYQH